MKPSHAILVASLALGCSGCTGNTTKTMAESCQELLDHGDRSGITSFIEDAQDQLRRLGEPKNKLTSFLQKMQDPDAMKYRPILDQCVWQLKNL